MRATLQKRELVEEQKSRLQEEVDRVVVEHKQVEEVLIKMGQKEQDLQLEKQSDREIIEELGSTCDRREAEGVALQKANKDMSEKIESLEKGEREGRNELNHRLEFLQSQMEEMETEKDELKKNKAEVEKEN